MACTQLFTTAHGVQLHAAHIFCVTVFQTFAAFWAVGVGDTVSLWREPSGKLRISVHAISSMHPAPAAGTRGRPGAAA